MDLRLYVELPEGDDLPEIKAFLPQFFDIALPSFKATILGKELAIGFGKTLEHNLELVAHLGELRSLGLPVMLGASRKSFIAKLDERASDPADRLGGSLAAAVYGVLGGVDLIRVHDVAATRQTVAVAHAITRQRRS
jgi:dihydropteroate synthase